MFDDDGDVKCNLMDLFREAMTGDSSPNTSKNLKAENAATLRELSASPPQSSDRPVNDLALERSLINLPTHIRTALEDRFIDLLHDYPCFYDPNDKNFAHNQFKSNTYAEIARRMCTEGLETSGPQLAAIFKGIKAKYRDETRKMMRMEGKVAPSPFYTRLGFLEHGLTTVDQYAFKSFNCFTVKYLILCFLLMYVFRRIAKMRGLNREIPPFRRNIVIVNDPSTSFSAALKEKVLSFIKIVLLFRVIRIIFKSNYLGSPRLCGSYAAFKCVFIVYRIRLSSPI